VSETRKRQAGVRSRNPERSEGSGVFCGPVRQLRSARCL